MHNHTTVGCLGRVLLCVRSVHGGNISLCGGHLRGSDDGDHVSPSHHGDMDHGLGDVELCRQPAQEFG